MLTKSQAMRERVVPVKWSETKAGTESDQPRGWGDEIDRDEAEIAAQEIVKSLPQKFRNKGAALMERINKSNALNYNKRGELIYKGQTIPGSHISDLVNDAIRRRKNFNPTGWQVFARALQELNFPKDLIGHKQRVDYMESMGGGDRFTAASAVPTGIGRWEAY